jgi:hypothetical protein
MRTIEQDRRIVASLDGMINMLIDETSTMQQTPPTLDLCALNEARKQLTHARELVRRRLENRCGAKSSNL